MKRALLFLVVLVVVAWIASRIEARKLSAEHTAQIASLQKEWQQQEQEMERRLDLLRKQYEARLESTRRAATPSSTTTGKTPGEILTELVSLAGPRSATDGSVRRRMIFLFEQLVAFGPAALPAIGDYLAHTQNAELANARDGLLPHTMRLAMIEAARRVGGNEVVALLAAQISSITDAEELVDLKTALDGLAPGTYTAAILDAAHNLLAGSGGEDTRARQRLFEFMGTQGDTSWVDNAKADLIRPDGRLDASALRYLNQILGAGTIDLMITSLKDQRLTDPDSQRTLIHEVSEYVGKNERATQTFQQFLLDESIPYDTRSWSIGKLNNLERPKPETYQQDVAVFQKRQELIRQLLTATIDERFASELRRMATDLDAILNGHR